MISTTTNAPPTTLPSTIHPSSTQITQNVHSYLDTHWSFSSDAYKTAFFAMDLPRIVALCYPEGEVTRVESAALFTTLTALLDDAFSQMSLSDSRDLGKRLLGILQGAVTAEPQNHIEKVLADVVNEMLAQNKGLAKDVVKGTIALFLAQTDKARLGVTELDEYFEFRFRDIGGDLFTAIIRFVNDITLTPSTLSKFAPLELATIRHVTLTNDIISWDKELKEATESNQEGAALFSAIPIVAKKQAIGFEEARAVLWNSVREYEGEIALLEKDLIEGVADGQGEEAGGDEKRQVERYIRGLKYLASGNEEWSKTTSRYRV
ncbi:isoprenoid synthase domain-containing protein [Aspergillus crustosus]